MGSPSESGGPERNDQGGAPTAAPVHGRAVATTLYAPGTFPRPGPAAPPIYRLAGGGRRPQEAIEVDIRLRAAETAAELMRVVQEALPRFETGNVVVAFTTAAKLDGGKDGASLEHSPWWPALQERVIECAASLEPRGMSMVAYAAARLMFGDPRLLSALASSGSRRASDFGATDVAKGTWAFAKLRYVVEPIAKDFWNVMAREADRTVRGARFVDVSMMAWAFAITGFGNTGIFAAVGAATWAPSEPLAPRSLAGTCWALARAGHKDEKLYREIARLAKVCARDFGAHDVAAICWGLAAADAVDRLLFEKLATHVVETGSIRKLGAPLAAELAWGFAAGGVEHVPLFEDLERLCVASLESLETEDVVGFAWAFATAGRRGSPAFEAIHAYAHRFAGRLRSSETKVLSWALSEVGMGPVPTVRGAEPPPPPVEVAVPPMGVARAPARFP